MQYPDNYLKQYHIDGAVNTDTHPCFVDSNSYPNFQEDLHTFKDLLLGAVQNGSKPLTFYKFGDGDFYFLEQISTGSAGVGNRALSKDYSDIKHEEFTSGAKLCDYYTCEFYEQNRNHFKEVIQERIDFPAEFGYGLVANKWLLKTFSGDIGLIGGKEKIDLIQTLMQSTEYQEYLGLEKFQDYITIPQKFACDNIDETEKLVAEQLKDSTSKIFLLGIGHVKSGLLHRLPKHKNAIYLDVGSAIDALCGVIDPDRPYFGAWTNYQIENYDYSNIDLLQYGWNGNIKKIKV